MLVSRGMTLYLVGAFWTSDTGINVDSTRKALYELGCCAMLCALGMKPFVELYAGELDVFWTVETDIPMIDKLSGMKINSSKFHPIRRFG